MLFWGSLKIPTLKKGRIDFEFDRSNWHCHSSFVAQPFVELAVEKMEVSFVEVLRTVIADGHPLIDLRDEPHYICVHLQSSVSLPLSDLKERDFELPPRVSVCLDSV